MLSIPCFKMELNREIRNEFRRAGQTRTARLVLASNLHQSYSEEVIGNHVKDVNNIVVGQDVIASLAELQRWTDQDYYEDDLDGHLDIIETVGHLGIIAIKLGQLTKTKLTEIIDWI